MFGVPFDQLSALSARQSADGCCCHTLVERGSDFLRFMAVLRSVSSPLTLGKTSNSPVLAGVLSTGLRGAHR